MQLAASFLLCNHWEKYTSKVRLYKCRYKMEI